MTTEELLIHELAERAGVSVRTIRYYIEEGLLPQPSYEGKYSYYPPKFLDRLELIRRLKDSYLPLREIREIINSLTDEEVHKKLKGTPRPRSNVFNQPSASPAKEKAGSRALEYIDHVLDDQTRYRTKGTNEKKLSADEQVTILQRLQLRQPETSPAPVSEEIWQHISLAPGVELHLRMPMDPDTENRVRQLINFTKRIFQIKS